MNEQKPMRVGNYVRLLRQDSTHKCGRRTVPVGRQGKIIEIRDRTYCARTIREALVKFDGVSSPRWTELTDIEKLDPNA